MSEQANFLEKQFQLSANGTNVRTEFIAGLTTFLTMVYIIFVNPDILAKAGMDKGAVFVATCLAAAVSTLVMGLYANYPIALAPGMGLNAFFAFTVVLGMKYTWQQALAAVFCSGVLFFLLSIFRVREYIIRRDPRKSEIRDICGRRVVPRHHRAGKRGRRRRSSGHAGDARQPQGCRAAAVSSGLYPDRGAECAQHHRRDADRHSRCGAARPAVRAHHFQRHRLDAAVVGADASADGLLAAVRTVLHRRHLLVPVHRRVRQCRHADRRHAARRASRQGRQSAAHEAGADLRHVCGDVRRGDRHFDHDELYRKRLGRAQPAAARG